MPRIRGVCVVAARAAAIGAPERERGCLTLRLAQGEAGNAFGFQCPPLTALHPEWRRSRRIEGRGPPYPCASRYVPDFDPGLPEVKVFGGRPPVAEAQNVAI